MPLTQNSTMPEKMKFVKKISGHGITCKVVNKVSIFHIFPVGSINIIVIPNAAPRPMKSVQKIRFLRNIDDIMIVIVNNTISM